MIDEARAAAAKDRKNVVLGGERHGKRIDGFDLGNSPSEYTPQSVGGRRWYMCVAGPKKPSFPSSRSYVPFGRSVCAWRDASPSMRGNEIHFFMR
jgi:hypothetical protein